MSDTLTHKLLDWFARRLSARVDDVAFDDSHCVACDSTELKLDAPGVYTCLACGYEGGWNRAAWIREQHVAQAALLPLEVRRARSAGFIREAHRALSEADRLYRKLGDWQMLETHDPSEHLLSSDSQDAFAHFEVGLHLLQRASDYDPELQPPALAEVKMTSQTETRDQTRAQVAELLTWLEREHPAACREP